MALPRGGKVDESVIVVGGGLAGLMTALKICEMGVGVKLFSYVPVKRSHSVCAQGGINAAVNTRGEGDSPETHFKETVKGGDFLGDQPLIRGMCHAAPGIINLMDRMGVPFSRTPEGHLDFRGFGGTLFHRTAHAGATTGQQLLYALDEQVRRYEAKGLVEKFELWEFLGLVKDEVGTVRGVVAMDLRDMKPKAFRSDAVFLATGGIGLIYGKSTNSIVCNGSAAGAAYRQGARFANGEFIQIHPTAIPGEDKLRLISESVRAEGGRLWVPGDSSKQYKAEDGTMKPCGKTSENWYFCEEWFPKYGNLMPRDIVSRAIHRIVHELGMGLDGGKEAVYLDIRHVPADRQKELEGVLDIYRKFMGEDPRKVPMKVYPAMHYSMGGLWAGYTRTADGFVDLNATNNQMSNLPGLFIVGEADHQYHGANRLGANSLLSCIYAGMIGGPSAVRYARGLERKAADLPASLFEAEEKRWTERFELLKKMSGPENPYRLHQELAETMSTYVGIARDNPGLASAEGKIREYQDRWSRTAVPDTTGWANQSLAFMNQLDNMLGLARIVVAGALARNESRGAHYKPEYPKRDDANWLKTTIADWTPDGPRLSYAPVDISILPPVARSYT